MKPLKDQIHIWSFLYLFKKLEVTIMILTIKCLKISIAFFFGTLLCIQGVYLISINKFHLGIALPLTIGICLILYASLFSKIQNILLKSHKLNKTWKILWCIFLLWLLSLCCFFIYLKINKEADISSNSIHAVIVLGSGIEKNKPSATLALRLDQAASYAKNSPSLPIVVTGGLGFKQTLSEAEVMKQYLVSKYKLTNPILLEDKSTSTEENLKNAAKILNSNGINISTSHLLIITSDFHVPRALAIAKHQSFQHSYELGADTPLYIRYNSWLREYFAYLSGFILNEY